MVDILRSLTVRASKVRRQHPRTRRHFVHVEFNFAQSRVRENRSAEVFRNTTLLALAKIFPGENFPLYSKIQLYESIFKSLGIVVFWRLLYVDKRRKYLNIWSNDFHVLITTGQLNTCCHLDN